MSRSTQELLREALAHFELMLAYAQDNEPMQQLVVDALCMRLSAGVEVMNRLDPDVRDGLFGDSWPLMWGMRNRMPHGYLLVDPVIIRRTLDKDIPAIIDQIKRTLADD